MVPIQTLSSELWINTCWYKTISEVIFPFLVNWLPLHCNAHSTQSWNSTPVKVHRSYHQRFCVSAMLNITCSPLHWVKCWFSKLLLGDPQWAITGPAVWMFQEFYWGNCPNCNLNNLQSHFVLCLMKFSCYRWTLCRLCTLSIYY